MERLPSLLGIFTGLLSLLTRYFIEHITNTYLPSSQLLESISCRKQSTLKGDLFDCSFGTLLDKSTHLY